MLSEYLNRFYQYFLDHEEQAFIAKALLLICVVLFLRNSARQMITVWLFLFVFAPVFLFIYARFKASIEGRSTLGVILDNISFMPVMYAENDWRKEGIAWATYTLVFVNVLIFYIFQSQAEYVVRDHLIFIPFQPNLFNVPLSLFSSIFLHGSQAHLWGNMMFLWAVGTVVEKRIGTQQLLLFYLVSGITGNLLGVFVTFLFMGKTLHCLGASGAISGVMGLFAVRCYFKTLVFPMPVLGLLSLFYPVGLKVRINALTVIGLFFLLDLSRGIDQVSGHIYTRTAHWVHVGGMLTGLILGFFCNLQKKASGERNLDNGLRADSNEILSFDQREKYLRKGLGEYPQNIDALLKLAQLKSQFEPSEEGRNLYEKVLGKLAGKDIRRAGEIFVEYLDRYGCSLSPPLHYHLAGALGRHGNLVQSARSLRILHEEDSTPELWAEKAMYQEGRVLQVMGQSEAARNTFLIFQQRFPDSELLPNFKSFIST